MPLSMTALASWCESDRWLAGMPVAEAVPMTQQAMVSGAAWQRLEALRSALA